MNKFLKIIKSKVLGSKEAKNAGWIIGGKIAQMGISFLVSILTARYLGPSNYGLINYATAYVTFFTSLCTLGINSVIIKNFIDYPEEQGKTVGTTLILRGVSSILSSIMIVGIVSIVDKGEPITILVTALCSCSLIFHVFDTLNYWFQARYESKVSAKAGLIAYIITAIYKILLLIFQKDVQWFAFATSVDYIFVAIFLFESYKKNGGPKFGFSLKKAKELLSSSYHYILSGMMVAIYGQTDKLMLKQMLGEAEVGYYSLATSLNYMWVFVLQAIIDSMYPTIIRSYNENKKLFERKNKQLYAIVIYVSIFVALIFMIFGEFGISLLYGKEYLPAAIPLKIIVWYTIFSYLGVARNAWIVCENKQKYLKYMYMIAALLNIILNSVFIPIMGTSGAALASLITQIATSIILPACIKDMRANARLMIEALLLKGIR